MCLSVKNSEAIDKKIMIYTHSSILLLSLLMRITFILVLVHAYFKVRQVLIKTDRYAN